MALVDRFTETGVLQSLLDGMRDRSSGVLLLRLAGKTRRGDTAGCTAN